jgi:hypothetical protein
VIEWRLLKREPTEYDRFTSLVDRVLSVPHSIIKERVDKERERIAANPNRPGPKTRKRKVIKPSAST